MDKIKSWNIWKNCDGKAGAGGEWLVLFLVKIMHKEEV